MRVAVDAMGGDHAPRLIVKGALAVAHEGPEDLELLLVGDEAKIQRELSRQAECPSNVRVVHAPERVDMTDAPATVFRRKKNSSIAVCASLHRDGEADAMVSAGSTGAVVATALLSLGRVKYVGRPAITTVIPTQYGGTAILDVGANTDCKATHLLQFGIMGAVYANCVLNKKDPAVGLLNIGEEPNKGYEVTQHAYRLMESSGLNFVGNVEGRDIYRGRVDVVVCDGFVGNVLLKFTESTVSMLYSLVREQIEASLRAKLGALLVRPVFRECARQMDYAEYGGAPLLGVDGVAMICHGKSSAKAISNAIRGAVRMIESNLNEHIRLELDVHGRREAVPR